MPQYNISMRVQLLTATEADARELVTGYAVDAVARARNDDRCDAFTFSLNEPPRQEGGSLGLLLFGASEDFIEAEREQWEALSGEGAIEDWQERPIPEDEMRRAQQSKFGEQGGGLAESIFDLSSTMARHVVGELGGDEFPAAVDEFADEESQYPAGMWLLFHHMAFANFGYSATEEAAMHMEGIEEDLRIFAERNSEDDVDELIDELIDDLDDMREQVKQGRPQP